MTYRCARRAAAHSRTVRYYYYRSLFQNLKRADFDSVTAAPKDQRVCGLSHMRVALNVHSPQGSGASTATLAQRLASPLCTNGFCSKGIRKNPKWASQLSCSLSESARLILRIIGVQVLDLTPACTRACVCWFVSVLNRRLSGSKLIWDCNRTHVSSDECSEGLFARLIMQEPLQTLARRLA
jgi:hypothetical protein